VLLVQDLVLMHYIGLLVVVLVVISLHQLLKHMAVLDHQEQQLTLVVVDQQDQELRMALMEWQTLAVAVVVMLMLATLIGDQVDLVVLVLS
tara:strand:+ start:275 stop:547 length:273 start_codon:yes stop_codon:yes gene_type:complete